MSHVEAHYQLIISWHCNYYVLCVERALLFDAKDLLNHNFNKASNLNDFNEVCSLLSAIAHYHFGVPVNNLFIVNLIYLALNYEENNAHLFSCLFLL